MGVEHPPLPLSRVRVHTYISPHHMVNKDQNAVSIISLLSIVAAAVVRTDIIVLSNALFIMHKSNSNNPYESNKLDHIIKKHKFMCA
jgi:hypothetical protein